MACGFKHDKALLPFNMMLRTSSTVLGGVQFFFCTTADRIPFSSISCTSILSKSEIPQTFFSSTPSPALFSLKLLNHDFKSISLDPLSNIFMLLLSPGSSQLNPHQK
jgi:hypothetical protein